MSLVECGEQVIVVVESFISMRAGIVREGWVERSRVGVGGGGWWWSLKMSGLYSLYSTCLKSSGARERRDD